MAVYVGHYADSVSGKYFMEVKVIGACGHAFDDQTRKTVWIFVVRPADERELLKRKYVIRGSDVQSDMTWSNDNEVGMVLYDHGPSGGEHDAKRIILNVKYRYNPLTGKFE